MFAALMLAGAMAVGAAPPIDLPPTPRFRHYGVNQGLPSDRVYTSVQDPEGYIWVGTGDGLARFDGKHFQVFRHDPRDPASLPSNDIGSLLIDSRGQLWAGGGGSGLNRLQADGSGFDHWLHDADDPHSLSSNDIMALAEDAQGRILVGVYGGGLNRLRADGSGFDHWRHQADDPDTLASNTVLSLHVDDKDRIWVGTIRGLDVIEPQGSLRHIRFAEADKVPWVWEIREDQGGLLLSTNDGLFRLGTDGIARPWPSADVATGSMFSSLRDVGGGLWLGTRDALKLLDGRHPIRTFKPRNLQPGALQGHIIIDIAMDSVGGLWLSSLDGGLSYLSPDWRLFSRLASPVEEGSALRSTRIMSMAMTPQGKLLVGGISGKVDLLDPNTGVATPLPGTDGLSSTIRSLAVSESGDVWIGMQEHLYLLRDGRRQTIEFAADQVPVAHLLATREGVLVALLGQGIYRVNAVSLKAEAVPLAFDDAAGQQTISLIQVRGRVWRASQAGLARLADDGSHFVAVKGVAPGPVKAFDISGDRMWVARQDYLEQYRRDRHEWQLINRVTVEDGFPAVEMSHLFVDSAGRVWMTSRVGLWRYEPGKDLFRRYGVDDGLPSPQFTDALVKTSGGVVLAGTLSGVVGFHPGSVVDHARKPGVILESVSAMSDGQRVPLPVGEDGQVQMQWDQNALRVAVQALSFVNPERNRYRFRMHDFDQGWVSTGDRGVRQFTGLPPGRHELEAQAAGASGVWADLPHRITIDVDAPPWQRPWAWALYIVAGLLLIVAIWRASRQRLKRRMELQLLHEQRRLAEEASEAKTRFLATMGHEIRTPMTGVLGMAELLTGTDLAPSQADMVRTIRHSGELLLKLVNDALDMARIEAGRFELDNNPLDPVQLMHEVVALQEGIASNKGVALRLEVGEGVPGQVLGDAIRLRQILLNLLNNALKFTEHGSITLSLDMQGSSLCYRVSDTGAGMDEDLLRRLFRRFEQGDSGSDSGGSGLGLAICKELSELMGGSIGVQAEVGQGSTFTVVLPLPACSSSNLRGGDAEKSVAVAKGGKVLLVEDDQTIARVMTGLLQRQGYQVTCAGQALAALADFDNDRFEIVLVDLDLPDMDGFALIGMLRALPGGDRLHVVVVTARSNRADEIRAREVGADDFLRKPVSGSQLQMVLNHPRSGNGGV